MPAKTTPLASRMKDSVDKHRAESTKTNNATLGEVGELARKQMMIEDEIERLEEQLKAKKQELQTIATKTLPDAMTKVGLDEFKLTNGAEITVSPFYSVSLKDENKEKALAAMRKAGYGSLIKHGFEVDFPSGQDKAATQFKKSLQKDHRVFSESEGIHAQTLKKFIRSVVEDGNPKKIDLSLFNAFIGRKASIKRPAN